MSNKAWTYHVIQIGPRKKTFRVMEGIRPVASCSREKDARLIVSMKETNAELLEALLKIKTLLKSDSEYGVTRSDGLSMPIWEAITIGDVFDFADAAIAKANGG